MLDFKVFVYFIVNSALVGCLPTPQYLGGYLTFTAQTDSTGKHQADVELVTRWVLKSGPCGPMCDQSKVGTSTLPYRTLAERVSHNPYFFGLLSVETQKLPGLFERRVINDLVKPTMTEVVHAIGDDWEEELMKFTIVVDETFAEKTIRFDGFSWANLTLQGPGLNWNLKTGNNIGKRPDTQKANTGPVFMSKRIYRTKLEHKATLKIVSFDVDSDLTTCQDEFGTTTGDIGHVPGVVVKQDCTVEIDTKIAHGFGNNTRIAIPISLSEFPNSAVTVNNQTYTGTSSIGSTGIQFIVQVLENVELPEFVSPTTDTGHEFILLEGDTWTTKVYAKPATGKTIAEFQLRTLYSEAVTKTPTMVDGSRADIKFTTVSWSPKVTDVGKHILCVTAVDSERASTIDDVCYVLNVLRKILLIGPPFMTKHFHLGDPVLLDCLIAGTTTPVFYWHKDNGCDAHIQSFSGAILNVTSHATIGHEGTYVCVGSDGMYQNVTKTFHVQIIRGNPHREECSFENGTCGWEQKQTDTMDWALIKGPTQTGSTGPDSDHTMGNSSGMYFYIETSSPIQLGDSAELMSHVLPAKRTMCFNFWYHMYGDGIGHMSVHIQDSCTLNETTLFSVQGEQGNTWLEHQFEIPDTMVANDYRIIIEGVAGTTFRGDLAVDDVFITEGPCPVKGAAIVIDVVVNDDDGDSVFSVGIFDDQNVVEGGVSAVSDALADGVLDDEHEASGVYSTLGTRMLLILIKVGLGCRDVTG